MNNFHFFLKKTPWWITYPVLFLFAFSIVGTTAFFYIPRALAAASLIVPFEGRVSYIEYNCLCSGSILLYVTPENTTNSTGEVAIMYYWAADFLSRIIGDLIDFPLPAENIRPFKNIWTGKLLGAYVPISVPCVAYIGTGCTVTEEATGILLVTGTSLY